MTKHAFITIPNSLVPEHRGHLTAAQIALDEGSRKYKDNNKTGTLNKLLEDVNITPLHEARKDINPNTVAASRINNYHEVAHD